MLRDLQRGQGASPPSIQTKCSSQSTERSLLAGYTLPAQLLLVGGAPARPTAHRGHRRATRRACACTPRLHRPGSRRTGTAVSRRQSAIADAQALLSPVVPVDEVAMQAQAVAVSRSAEGTTYAVVVEARGAGPHIDGDGACRLEQGLLTVDKKGKAANGSVVRWPSRSRRAARAVVDDRAQESVGGDAAAGTPSAPASRPSTL